MLPKISVIIPVLNRQDLIIRCLESVRNQTVRPYELIIVDNNSSDATLDKVKTWIAGNKSFNIKIKLATELQRGASFARQKGLEKAEGDYIIFFDSDDVMRKELIEVVSKKLRENPFADIACWKCKIHLLGGGSKVPSFHPENPVENHLIHTLLRTQGYAVKKELLYEVGGWSKNLPVWNDFELGLRLLLRNPDIIGINKILVDIYAQKDSLTGQEYSTKKGLWELSLREAEAECSRHGIPEKDKIYKILDYRKAILAAQYKHEDNNTSAKTLLTEALTDKKLFDRLVLYFAFFLTSLRIRGVWKLIRPFYGF